MPTCLIYTRVSTDPQERDGTSLETQFEACRQYADSRGWTILAAYSDTASGFVLDRPGLRALRTHAMSGAVDFVLSHALDRLSRKQTHVAILAEECETNGLELAFVLEKFEDTAVGQLVRSVKAFAAEFEREKIAERTTRGKIARAQGGRLPQGTGAGCYGYIYDALTGRRTIEPEQAEVVRRTFAHFLETHSLSATAQWLNANGVPAFRGGRWHPLTIRRLLLNEAYTGRTLFRRTKRTFTGRGRLRRTQVVVRPPEEQILIPDATPAIVDTETWERVRAILLDPEHARRRATANQYLLRHRTHCMLCSGAVVGQTLTTKGKAYRYYRCRHVYDGNTGRNCAGRYIPADLLEARVWEQISAVLADPAVILNEVEHKTGSNAPAVESYELEARLKQLRAREQRLVRLYGLGNVSEAALAAEMQEVHASIARIEERQATLHAEVQYPQFDADGVRETARAIRAWLAEADPDDRALVLEALQIRVSAKREMAIVDGILPADLDGSAFSFINEERSCRCLFNGDLNPAEQIRTSPALTHVVDLVCETVMCASKAQSSNFEIRAFGSIQPCSSGSDRPGQHEPLAVAGPLLPSLAPGARLWARWNADLSQRALVNGNRGGTTR